MCTCRKQTNEKPHEAKPTQVPIQTRFGESNTASRYKGNACKLTWLVAPFLAMLWNSGSSLRGNLGCAAQAGGPQQQFALAKKRRTTPSHRQSLPARDQGSAFRWCSHAKGNPLPRTGVVGQEKDLLCQLGPGISHVPPSP